MPEWDKLARYFDLIFADRTADIPFWKVMARRFGPEILELGCGTGRLTMPMAKAGVKVTGIDISQPMLSVARRKLKQESHKTQKAIRLIFADARDFSLPKTNFSAVFCPNGIMVESEAELQSLIRSVSQHLIIGGMLILDVFNYPDLRHNLRNHDYIYMKSSGGYDFIRQIISTVNIRTKIVNLTSFLDKIDQRGKVKRIMTRRIERIFNKDDLVTRLKKNHFKIIKIYGNYSFRSWQKQSPRLIIVAKYDL